LVKNHVKSLPKKTPIIQLGLTDFFFNTFRIYFSAPENTTGKKCADCTKSCTGNMFYPPCTGYSLKVDFSKINIENNLKKFLCLISRISTPKLKNILPVTAL
jgi:hypothetical protein